MQTAQLRNHPTSLVLLVLFTTLMANQVVPRESHPYAFHVSGPRKFTSLNWRDLFISSWSVPISILTSSWPFTLAFDHPSSHFVHPLTWMCKCFMFATG